MPKIGKGTGTSRVLPVWVEFRGADGFVIVEFIGYTSRPVWIAANRFRVLAARRGGCASVLRQVRFAGKYRVVLNTSLSFLDTVTLGREAKDYGCDTKNVG